MAVKGDDLVVALQGGDEAAFMALVQRYHAPMVRFAAAYLKDRTAAEDVAQEAWLAVLRGLDGFEGRSSLHTWIFAIVRNLARTRAKRDGRIIPFSALEELAHSERAVDAAWFRPADDPEYARWWNDHPRSWDDIPAARLLAAETRAIMEAAIHRLPPAQRLVLTLRDIEGWNAADTCSVLDVSATNQRVLLHRARSRVRRVLERYLDEERR